MNKTIKTVSLAVVALVAIYLGYQLLERWMNPCEGVFQQSAVGLNTKLDVIKTKGEFAIGRQNVQELKDRAQEVALNLKTCCIVLGKASSDFLRCKEGFERYEMEVKKVATLVTEAEAAKGQGNSEVAVQKIAEANESIKVVEATAQQFTQQVAQIKEKPSEKGGAQAGGQSAPVATGYKSVHMKAWPEGSRFRVKVNGLLVGTYDTTIELDLEPFLKVGSVNTVTFTFDRLPKNLYGVVLTVQVAGSEKWVQVFTFIPSKERLEDSFEVPFVGAKKQ